MTQRMDSGRGESFSLRWTFAVLAIVAGSALFWIAGGIWFDLAEIDASAGPWSWLTGAGVLLGMAGFLAVLFLTSNVLIRRQRALPFPRRGPAPR